MKNDIVKKGIEELIKQYDVQELKSYDPNLLTKEEENHAFMICSKALLIDFLKLGNCYNLVNESKDKKNIENLKIKAQIIDLVGKL